MRWLESLRNRKLILFLLSLLVIFILSYFGRETTSVVALYSAYCVGNAASKFANNIGGYSSCAAQ